MNTNMKELNLNELEQADGGFAVIAAGLIAVCGYLAYKAVDVGIDTVRKIHDVVTSK